VGIKLVAFDLDGTLAPSKGPISNDMGKALRDLLGVAQVCIISGGTREQIMSQVVDLLPDKSNLRNLHIMPTSGAQYLKRHLGGWRVVYSEKLSEEEIERITQNIHVTAALLGEWPENPHGAVIENRGTQVTFSALGQNAPIEEKELWDPTGVRKDRFRRTLASLLLEFDVRSGGSTSIDITKVGIDKGFGIDELIKRTGLKPDDVLFVGDRLDEGGNDHSVMRTGANCYPVDGPLDTLQLIKDLLKAT
jgi:HAD superfamily hydrolase (TIGR01484 family)